MGLLYLSSFTHNAKLLFNDIFSYKTKLMGILFLHSNIMANLSFSQSSFSSNPLISCIITLFILILIYFPHVLIISPLLVSTLILVISLLRLGTSQQIKQQEQELGHLNFGPGPGPGPEYEYESVEVNQRTGKVVIYSNEEQDKVKPEPEPEPEPEPKPKHDQKVEFDRRKAEMAKVQCSVALEHTTLKPEPKPKPNHVEFDQKKGEMSRVQWNITQEHTTIKAEPKPNPKPEPKLEQFDQRKGEAAKLQCNMALKNSTLKPEPKPEPEHHEKVEFDQRKGDMAKVQCNNINVEHTIFKPKPWSETKPGPKPELEEFDQRKGEMAKVPCNIEYIALEHTSFEPEPKLEVKQVQEKEVDHTLYSLTRSQCMGWVEPEPVPAFGPNIFLEWDVGAPLEVIYEAYEGEEEENDAFLCNVSYTDGEIIEKYEYYPESDSDSDLDSNSSSKLWFDEREQLIEIALDYGYGNKGINNMITKPTTTNNNNNNSLVDHEEFLYEEDDNLIEIDISPTKFMYRDFF
ncbi:uncharacterized protein LOC130823529 [Amaranthus tricolor]|uniref:uncharacterized protein LOC130823529 n=1 Tax=Amaranthus tricolor TaxID=29722 RepID=UPI00258308CF|nr:uncharacterized protein LOC130823529 [Amaranthus tricolor]